MRLSAAAPSGDAAARERIRTSLGESLIVEASAGTGKTTELIHRIVAVLEQGVARIDQIVAVTFTNKAAGELKLRLRQRLDESRAKAADAATRRNLEDALEHLEEAVVGTIHSFCAQILRERPVEARIDPAFEEISEQEAERLYERAFRGWIQEALNAPSPGLRRALLRLAWRDPFDASSPMEQIQVSGWRLIEWRDFPAPWRRVMFDRRGSIDRLVEEAGQVAELAGRAHRGTDNLARSLLPAVELVIWIQRSEAAARRDYDMLEALLLRLLRDLKRNLRRGAGFYAPDIRREDVLARRDALISSLEQFQRDAGADLAVLLRDELWPLVERYDQVKRRAGKLDFVDLLVGARDLVRGNAEVRRYLQGRFTHIFVDEFQDTDPLQAEILLLLAADDPEQNDWLETTPVPGKLFVVGDPKQSIYKFRRADVVLYRQVRDALSARGVGLARLTKSFRSARPVQDCVNAAFATEMTGDEASGQAEYVPLEEHLPAIPGQPAVIALPAPSPYGKQRIAKTAIDACLPEAVIALVEWLLRESGWKVRHPESPGQLVPITARHVCILFRRFINFGEDLTRPYVRSLEARGIPHMLVGSKSFHKREEVETLRAALSAIEWPEDELSVFATLKGSLFAIPDSTLFRFRFEIGRLHPFARLPEDLDAVFQPVAEALSLLGALHRGRNRRPVADTVNLLLEAARAHAGFAFRPAGHQALANVYRIADLARGYEATGGISFRGFVEALEAEAEKARSAEAPVLEEGAEGVRLMTVHAAKGLEFPVVILADMTANLAASEADKHVDARSGICAQRILRCAPHELLDREAEEHTRELAEGVRVAYVAATRARDLLVVPACGDEERDGWVAPLNKAIYPEPVKCRQAGPAPGCPAFGNCSVVNRPDFVSPEPSVKPGLHAPRVGSHGVVWWDPRLLKPAAKPNFGLTDEELLSGDDAQAAEGLARYRAWKSRGEETIAAASAPSVDILLATEAAAPGEEFPVAIESLPRAPDRPAGPRFGTLVHQVLRDVSLTAAREEIADAALLHARLAGAPAEEIAAAVDAVEAALRHPILRQAGTSARLHREYPVILKLDGNRVLEGVIDLAFLDNGAWHIVDFKTDADLPANQPRYLRQVAWYARALREATALPVRATLLNL